LILLTSDHGEGFLDHPPHTLHGDHVYQEQISVPCVLRFPEGSAAPAILDRPTASIDLMPTLLHAIGIQAPDGVEGHVLLGIRGSGEGAVGEPDLYCEATTPHSGQKVHPNEVGTRWLNERKRRCIRSGKYKYIIYPFNPKESPQLFDLSVDWAERANLLQTAPGEYEAMAAELHSKLMAWGQGSEGIDSKLSEDMSEADIDALKALGYL
jgi:N-acetylglucosamine-6-sulfatase